MQIKNILLSGHINLASGLSGKPLGKTIKNKDITDSPHTTGKYFESPLMSVLI